MIRTFVILLLSVAVIVSACQAGNEGRDHRTPAEYATSAVQEPGIQTQSIPGIGSATAERSQYKSFSTRESVEFDIALQLTLVNDGPGSPSKQNLWVALISDVYPYQEVLERDVSPGDYHLFTDEYGNQIAEFDFSDMQPGSEVEVQINYRVRVNQLENDLSNCYGEMPGFYTEPDLHIESQNPQIQQLSTQLSEGKRNACQQVRAFYDYIGNELVYSYNGGNWGAQGALGQMGADCTEYASLMVALSRAAGIPARYVEGLSYTPEGEEALARLEHAWLEVYLPGTGWTPMDPTLGRSSITREQYFAKLPADHIIVTRGRNPSALRGGSYWTYLYWPGDSTTIKIEQGEWSITLRGE